MQGFHIPAAPPLYTNTFLLISDAGHAVVIDPAAEVHSYNEILKQHNATLTTIPVSYTHLYICHPLAVARLVLDLGMDSESIAAALLHDVVAVSYTHLDVSKRPEVAGCPAGALPAWICRCRVRRSKARCARLRPL